MTDEQRQIERLTFWMGRDAAEAYAEAMTAKRLAEESVCNVPVVEFDHDE